MEKIIYGLTDPITGELRYVGQTNNLSKRYSRHLKNAAEKGRLIYTYAWIRGLLNKGLKPGRFVIDVVEDADYWEEFYINYFLYIGCNLTNLRRNVISRGVFKMSEEAKLKISKALKGKQNTLGKVLTEAHKDKISKALKGRTFSKETIRKICIGNQVNKEVHQYSIDGTFIKTWRNAYEAAEKLKLNRKAIGNVLAGRANTSGGFIWKY